MINDLLNELAQLYNDFDKETNFRRKYANLSQEKKQIQQLLFDVSTSVLLSRVSRKAIDH